MTALDVDHQKLLEGTTLSSADSFTKTRRPQYKTSNESAAQRGRPIEPGTVLTPSVALTEDADWDMMKSEESTVIGNGASSGAGSGSGYTAAYRRRPSTNVNNSKDKAIDDDDSHQLTTKMLELHDLINNQLSWFDRIRMQDRQAKHSIIVKRTLTRVSESTIDLGEAYSPATAHSPEPDIFAVGAWADEPMPPMA